MNQTMGLCTRGISMSFGSTEVLREVDMVVEAGELATVLGRSGCGKTTLLRIVAGLLTPGRGSVVLGGCDITALPTERRRISLVPQEGALFPHLSVARNVGFGLRRSEQGRVPELLELVGLGELASRMPHEISGGQAQRVALARALAVEPELVLLDEPFSALDSASRVQLRSELRHLLKRTGTTAVLVTHDQEEALALSDRVVLMAEGRVIQTGTPQQVYQQPTGLTAARLSGSVQTLKAEAAGMCADTVIGEVVLHSPAQGSGTVVLRPEQIRAVPAAEGEWTVFEVTFHGDSTDLTLRHDGAETAETLVARTQQPGWQVGDRVTVMVDGAATFEES
ncbi:MAG: ABC transporter ATP-binding protein [Propionibacteriaceae bacterium]|nr:ABC transporter ATP-binding protein [Propionibacteriaceae bacterium]